MIAVVLSSQRLSLLCDEIKGVKRGVALSKGIVNSRWY
jgi:hypothetical protein